MSKRSWTSQEISEVVSSVRLSEFVAKDVPLKEQDGVLVGECPFHEGGHETLRISPVMEFYHCSHCRAHGNIIDWVKAFWGKDFDGAMRELMQRRDFSHIPSRVDEPLTLAAIEIQSRFETALEMSSWAQDVLKNFGLSLDQAKHLGIGLCEPAGLSDVSQQALLSLGLVDNDSLTLASRLTFPLRKGGAVRGWAGMALRPSAEPWVISANTSIFQVDACVFGPPQRSSLLEVYYVETIEDAIVLFSKGLPAFCHPLRKVTEATISECFSVSSCLHFLFSGEAAGQEMMFRAFLASAPFLTRSRCVIGTKLPYDAPSVWIQEERFVELKQLMSKPYRLGDFCEHVLRDYPAERAQAMEYLQLLFSKMKDCGYKNSIISRLYKQGYQGPQLTERQRKELWQDQVFFLAGIILDGTLLEDKDFPWGFLPHPVKAVIDSIRDSAHLGDAFGKLSGEPKVLMQEAARLSPENWDSACTWRAGYGLLMKACQTGVVELGFQDQMTIRNQFDRFQVA